MGHSNMLNDGFGDDLDIAEVIEGNEHLLRLKAADRLRGSNQASDVWDDVLQEGRIVQLEVLTKRPDAPREYVSAAMSMRMSEVLKRGTWTGMATAQGKPRDPLRLPMAARTSTDDPDVVEIVDGVNWVDDVIGAYHHGEIAEAISALTFTQRQHVFARIWCGMSDPEIAALQGCARSSVERRWRTEIRPHLQEHLGHLA